MQSVDYLDHSFGLESDRYAPVSKICCLSRPAKSLLYLCKSADDILKHFGYSIISPIVVQASAKTN